MKAKHKNLLMLGVIGVAGYAMYQASQKKKVTAITRPVNSDGRVEGAGWGAVKDALDEWLDPGETRPQITDLVIPGVTKSDLEAYAAGHKYGEVPGYTWQDWQLINDTLE